MTPAFVSILSPSVVPTLFEAALRSLAVALTVWAGIRLFGIRNVLAQKTVWSLVLASALAMPLAMNLGMRWQVLPNWAAIRLPRNPWALAAASRPASPSASAPATPQQAVQTPELAVVGVGRFPAPRVSYSDPQPQNQVTVLPSSEPVIHPAQDEQASAPANQPPLQWATVASLLYLAVCALLLIRLLYGLGLSMRMWRQARPVTFHSAGAIVSRLAGAIPVRASTRIASPVTIGSGIVLPADYADWDREKLRVVLAHESSHIRQGDFYLQLLAGLYASMFWFSPLGWWLKRKLSELGETISDRAGLEEAASRSSYAQILIEFAALPRPTPIGVAMARTSTLSHRIERLLNDSSFRQAFAGSRGRALLAVLLVPVALFAATALIRVEAAAATPTVQAAPQAPATGQSNPDQAPDPDQAQAPAPASSAAPTPAPPMSPAPSPDVAPAAAPLPAPPQAISPEPPEPPEPLDQDKQIIIKKEIHRGEHKEVRVERQQRFVNEGTGVGHGNGHGYSYSYSSNGETYALVSGPNENVTFSGDWNHGHSDDIKKAARMAHGPFLWFLRDGKSYFVEDPAMLAQIEALNSQMSELGRKQEELGREQEKLGEKQGEIGRKQSQATVPTPDISKEMAKLNAAAAKLQAKFGKTVTREELADLQGELGEIQGKLGALQGEMGGWQGEFGRRQGELGAEQGRLGAQQGKLGAEQGRLAHEADQKVKSIIDESLKNGKARPVN